MASIKAKISWSTIVSRGVLFTLIWGILTDGAATSWWIGVPTVLLAVATSTALLPQTPFVWYEVLKFIPFFLRHSLIGGADVAWRSFHPDLPISPDLLKYLLRLPPGLPRVFMTNTVSLLPGTLSAVLDGSILIVHVLDSRRDVLAELEALEQRMARMFGISLSLSGGGQ